jgi:hypothetical protein
MSGWLLVVWEALLFSSFGLEMPLLWPAAFQWERAMLD